MLNLFKSSKSIKVKEPQKDVGIVDFSQKLKIEYDINSSKAIKTWKADCGCTGMYKEGDKIILEYTTPSMSKVLGERSLEQARDYYGEYYDFGKGARVYDQNGDVHRINFKGRIRLPDSSKSKEDND